MRDCDVIVRALLQTLPRSCMYKINVSMQGKAERFRRIEQAGSLQILTVDE